MTRFSRSLIVNILNDLRLKSWRKDLFYVIETHLSEKVSTNEQIEDLHKTITHCKHKTIHLLIWKFDFFSQLSLTSFLLCEENNLLESVKQNSFMTEIATQLDVKCPRRASKYAKLIMSKKSNYVKVKKGNLTF